MTRRHRLILVALAVVLAVLGFLGSRTAPRVTLLNAAVSIDHSWLAKMGAVAVVAAFVLLAFAISRRALRVLLLVAAIVPLLWAWEVAAYRLEAGARELRERRGWLRQAIPWKEVMRVESEPLKVVVWGRTSGIEVDTSRFTADQRAGFDRTISRRIKEH